MPGGICLIVGPNRNNSTNKFLELLEKEQTKFELTQIDEIYYIKI